MEKMSDFCDGGVLAVEQNVQSFLVFVSITVRTDVKWRMDMILIWMKSICSNCPLSKVVVSNVLPLGEWCVFPFQQMVKVSLCVCACVGN